MKHKQLKAAAKPMSSMMISEFIKSSSPATKAAFERHKKELLEKLADVQSGDQDALAGFMFAFAEIGNEIGRRYNVQSAKH